MKLGCLVPPTWNYRNRAAFCAAGILILGCAPQSAQAAEILIDQTKVMAGGITPGNTAGFPATISRPGKYKLVGNLTVPAGKHGIAVTANHVTIDLNGFSVIGATGGGLTDGINAPNRTNLTVLNGTITGFAGSGINNSGGVFLLADGVKAFRTGLIGITSDHYAQIRRSHATQNSLGISCKNECHIEGNTVAGNGNSGIQITHGLVLANVITGNKSFGITTWVAAGPVGIGNNTIYYNTAGSVTVGVFQLQPNFCIPACP